MGNQYHEDIPMPDRFWSKVDICGENECWVWLASRLPTGYGQFRLYGKMRKAHVVAYVLTHGTVPEGMQVNHKCVGRPDCCNPKHLYAGTHYENMRDMVDQGRHIGQAPGEAHSLARLSNADVLEIRRLYSEDGYPQNVIADMFGISRTQVHEIIYRKRWASI